MPYTNDPANSLTDRVRLFVGDIWPDMELLSDTEYQYFLDSNNNSVRAAILDAVRCILFKISRFSRERTGDIEVYGAEYFKNYKAALEEITSNPFMAFGGLNPWAGGVSYADMQQNNDNEDNVLTHHWVDLRRQSSLNRLTKENAFLYQGC
jgi:hypothetical protein